MNHKYKSGATILIKNSKNTYCRYKVLNVTYGHANVWYRTRYIQNDNTLSSIIYCFVRSIYLLEE